MANTTAEERQFLKVFAIVISALVMFTLFCIFLARTLAPSSPGTDAASIAARESRIVPVGQVATSADQLDAVAAPAETASGPTSAQDIVNTACMACHQTGVAGAPIYGEAAAWEPRVATGVDAMLASVINGKGAMPPRAGTTFSDEELRAAVELIAGVAGGTEGGDAAADVVEGAVETVKEAAAEVKEAATDAVESATAAVTETAEKVTDAAKDAVQGATAAVAGAVAPAAGNAVAMISGGDQAAASAEVKGVVDSLCVGCHLAGVAGAPKIGDKAAWDAKAEKGLDAMVEVAIKGIGGMPPRGGSSLSDDDMRAAIQYLMSK